MSVSPDICVKKWSTLESDPDTLTEYIHNMGVPSEVVVSDVYGLDDELLAMLPQPVYSILLLLPVTGNVEKWRMSEEYKLTNNIRGLDKDADPAKYDEIVQFYDNINQETTNNTVNSCQAEKSVYWLPQRIGNACGTMAIIHSVMNSDLNFTPDSFFDKMKRETTALTPIERAQWLETDNEVESLHTSLAAVSSSEETAEFNDDIHFVAFTIHNGQLVELDGRKHAAISHGPSDNLLHSVRPVLQRYMDLQPGDIRFSMLAICQSDF